MTGKTENSCANCTHHLAIKSQQEIGKVDHICRFNPPIPIAIQTPSPQGIQLRIISVWTPIPDADARCGQHQPIKPALSVVS